MSAFDEKSLARLLAIEAIQQLKYAYLRHLDLKEWDALAALFTPDAVSAYADGEHSYQGRDAIMQFLSGALGHAGVVTRHQVHHPEITLNDTLTEAHGTWYLSDAVINTVSRNPAKHFCISGAGFYDDSYRKTDDGWKISSIGYRRVFEETVKWDHDSRLAYRSRFTSDGT
jgi:hypothetical protein